MPLNLSHCKSCPAKGVLSLAMRLSLVPLETAEHEIKAFSCSQNHVRSENCECLQRPWHYLIPCHHCNPARPKMLKGPVPTSLTMGSPGKQHRHSTNLLKLVAHISELVYKALQLLGGRLACISQEQEKVMFCVWCTLHISAPPKQQQDTMSLSYESLENGFECFSHIITAELAWCHGKSISRETALSQFFFFCW